MKYFPIQLIGALIVFAAVAGCSEPHASLSGKVTYKDKPVTGGTVIFVGEDGKQTRAEIQPDGMYSSPGVPLGNLKIGVQPAPKGPAGLAPKGAKRPPIEKDNPLEGVYGKSGGEFVDIPEALRNPETSKITKKIDADTKTYDIPLK